jgi:hypothetical protein
MQSATTFLRLGSIVALMGALGCSHNGASTHEPDRSNKKNKLAPSNEVETRMEFVDVAPKAGIRFVPRNGMEAGHCSILETLGTGVALFDYDSDGDLDLFFVGGGRFQGEKNIVGLKPVLYRNEGQWKFTDVTSEAHVNDAPFFAHAAIAADYNNDGAPDLLITGYHGLLLYHNNGDRTFSEVSKQVGLINDAWSSAAAWGDWNADGLLDLYIVNYVDWSFANHRFCGRDKEHRDVCPPGDFEALSDRLFLANQDGTFRDATKQAGLKPGGKGLGVVAADLDLDGDLDIYVANDTTPNFLYRNDGLGRFEEIGIISGAALSELGTADGSMGVDVGDYDLDGLPDLWVANFENQSFALYRNLGDCIFQHQSKTTGIAAARGIYVGFGSTFFDGDRDGDEDIFAANGHVMYHSQNSPYRQVPLLFENIEGQRFASVGKDASTYFTTPHVGRGAATGDLDNDGRVDLVVTHSNEPIALLKNISRDENNWLQIKLRGSASNRDAVGARVVVETEAGKQSRQVKAGASYLSTSDKRLFFGLGTAKLVKRIEISWPSGSKEVRLDIPANQFIEIGESPGQ